MKITFKINVEGIVKKLRIKVSIPHTIKDRQIVKSNIFSINPDSIYMINNAEYASFTFADVSKSFKIILKSSLEIFTTINQKNDSIEKDLAKYLIAETDIESESTKIKEQAAKLKMQNDIETVIKTFEFVQNNIRYEMKDDIGAERVLESGVGKCMDFSDLFVALLRANKIPAKSVFGIVADEEESENPLHAWPEAYLKKQGWVRFDPTTGHSSIERSGNTYVMENSNKYIILAEGRNDPEFRASPYKFRYKCEGDCKIKIHPSFDIFVQ